MSFVGRVSTLYKFIISLQWIELATTRCKWKEKSGVGRPGGSLKVWNLRRTVWGTSEVVGWRASLGDPFAGDRSDSISSVVSLCSGVNHHHLSAAESSCAVGKYRTWNDEHNSCCLLCQLPTCITSFPSHGGGMIVPSERRSGEVSATWPHNWETVVTGLTLQTQVSWSLRHTFLTSILLFPGVRKVLSLHNRSINDRAVSHQRKTCRLNKYM